MARPSFREQVLRAREDAILSSVNRLLAEKGFDAMTVEHRMLPSLLLIAAVWGIGLSVIRWLDHGVSADEEARTRS